MKRGSKLKKIISLSLGIIMMATGVYGSEISVSLNNENIVFENQPPVVVDGRTLIPLRGVFEKLGYNIIWDAESKTAVFENGTTNVAITANGDKFVVNNEEIPLDVPAQIINGSMMLPLRAVGEATGIEVNWDGENKKVELIIPESNTAETVSEAATEKAREITTEAVKENSKSDIPEEDMKMIRTAAEFYINYYSIGAMLGSIAYAENYNTYRIGGALQFSLSHEELEGFINDAIEECNMYKTAAKNIETGEYDENIVKKYISLTDALIEYYEFMRDSIFSGIYDDLSEEQFIAKMKGAQTAIESSSYNLIEAMTRDAETVWETVGESKYNVAYPEKLTADEKAEKDQSCSEIGKTVESAMGFAEDFDNVVNNADNFRKAAGEIRNKLENTQTPDMCIFDRELMLISCDILEKAGESIDNGAFTKDGNNVEYIEFEYCIFTFDTVFKGALGDEYEEKFFEEYSEDSDTEILEDIESKFV